MADVFKMTVDQLTFASETFKDAHGNDVPLSSLSLAFDSADTSKAAWEKRDPTPLQPDPNGQDCLVAQGGVGAVQVHCTATNPDGTAVTLVGDVEILAADAVSGVLTFGAAQSKPV